jgi:hypothetical protein
MSYYQLDGSGALTPITVGSPPMQVTKPYPLDGSGHAAADPTDDPATLDFYPYVESNYSGFSTLLS